MTGENPNPIAGGALSGKQPPKALSWVGGKSAYGNHKTGQWIHGLLPPAGATRTYIEPFAGMAGILLIRNPCEREILNDLDGDLVNWWRVVRDRSRELGELLDWTPGWSAAEFGEAVANLGCEDPLYRAYYFTLAVHWVIGSMIGRARGLTYENADSAIRRRPRGGHDRRQGRVDPKSGDFPVSMNTGKGAEMSPPRSPVITALGERVRSVRLESRPAELVVENYADDPDITWYLDPPYPSAAPASGLYSYNDLDVERWITLLPTIRGPAAISGYGNEWAELEGRGWTRNEHAVILTATVQPDPEKAKRTEVLWTNYDPEGHQPEQTLFSRPPTP